MVLDELTKWIINNGGYISDKLKVVHINDKKYNISAKSDIIIGEKLCQIPKKLQIGVISYNSIPNISKWNELDKKSNKLELIKYKAIISLIYEKALGANSKYYQYIKTLPTSRDLKYHPLYCLSKHKLEIWKYISNNFYNYICSDIAELETLYNYIKNLNDDIPIIDVKSIKFSVKDNILYKLIQWAFVIYNMKSLYSGEIIPYLDLFVLRKCNYISMDKIDNNQYIPDNMVYKLVQDNQENYCLVSCNDIKSDDNLDSNPDCYTDTQKILSRDGYIPENNKNYIQLYVQFNSKTSLEHLIDMELKKFNIDSNYLLLSKNGPSHDLSVYLKILSLNYSDLNIIQNKSIDANYPYNEISVGNTIKFLKTFLNFLIILKNNTYSIDKLKKLHNLVKDFNKSDIDYHLSSKLYEIIVQEYEIIENSIIWIHKKLLTLINTPYSEYILEKFSELPILEI